MFMNKFQALGRKIFRVVSNQDNGLTVLCYHRVMNYLEAGQFSNLVVNCSPESFENEICFLMKHYNIISIEKAVEGLQPGNTLPPGSLGITFDDGYKDNYTNVFPILKKYELAVTIFLTTDFIDNDKNLIWTDRVTYLIDNTKRRFVDIPGPGYHSLTNKRQKEGAKIKIIEGLKKMNNGEKDKIIESLHKELAVEIKNDIAKGVYLSSGEIFEMSKSNVSFGSHGCSHSILTKINLDEARLEIVNSKKKIEQITCKNVKFFAYPNGTPFDFNSEIIEVLKTAGYEAAFTTIYGVNRKDANPDMFSLKRILTGKSLQGLMKNLFMLKIKG